MKYKIAFLDYWHLSSGLSGGAKYDSSVVKDSLGFPYVPGKTIKGLLREYASGDLLRVCFGESGDNEGKCHFGNAVLKQATKDKIGNNQQYLFDFVSSTKIDENGVAETGSLREIEVVIPLTLYGSIDGIPETFKEEMRRLLKNIKRMGLNRTRGLGRCEVQVIGGE